MCLCMNVSFLVHVWACAHLFVSICVLTYAYPQNNLWGSRSDSFLMYSHVITFLTGSYRSLSRTDKNLCDVAFSSCRSPDLNITPWLRSKCRQKPEKNGGKKYFRALLQQEWEEKEICKHRLMTNCFFIIYVLFSVPSGQSLFLPID